jgi:methionine biosynthesis protein MetW
MFIQEQENELKQNDLRYDLQIIASLIPEKSKVLDIGCASGELLYFLQQNKKVQSFGLEISQNLVSKAIIKGLSVIQGNAESDLSMYPNQSFDYAILSQTIQATHNPPKILQEMLRISKFAIVSLPNFAFLQNRLYLMFKGEMPVNKHIPFQWYETPNIHFCSIKDFLNLCYDLNFSIHNQLYLVNNALLPSILQNKFIANLFAQYAIFLITKTSDINITQEKPIINSNTVSYLNI